MAESYHLSQQAKKDLEDIFEYTLEQFSLKQAISYVSSFETTFKKISTHPETGRLRVEIRDGLRSIIHESHVVFYRKEFEKIKIVRILHGSRDLPKQF